MILFKVFIVWNNYFLKLNFLSLRFGSASFKLISNLRDLWRIPSLHQLALGSLYEKPIPSWSYIFVSYNPSSLKPSIISLYIISLESWPPEAHKKPPREPLPLHAVRWHPAATAAYAPPPYLFSHVPCFQGNP